MSNVTLDFSTFHSIIGGRLEGTNKTRHNLNPSTPEANPEVPLSTRDDVDRAVKAAQETAATWANVPVADRQQAVIHFADALERLQDDFATVLVKEQGKPFQMARLELFESVKILRGMAELPFPEQNVERSNGHAAIVRYVPIGVAVGIVPWNFPVYLGAF